MEPLYDYTLDPLVSSSEFTDLSVCLCVPLQYCGWKQGFFFFEAESFRITGVQAGLDPRVLQALVRSAPGPRRCALCPGEAGRGPCVSRSLVLAVLMSSGRGSVS